MDFCTCSGPKSNAGQRVAATSYTASSLQSDSTLSPYTEATVESTGLGTRWLGLSRPKWVTTAT